PTAERLPMPANAPSTASLAEPVPIPPRFVTGSIARHILVMTGTSAVGLMSIFFSDFANIFFLGLVGDLQLLAAVGYASSILFFLTSGGSARPMAVPALVAPALAARRLARARRLATHAIVFAGGASVLTVALAWLMLPLLLGWLGSGGRTLALARDFLRIVLPSLPPLALGMCASAVLRSAGGPPPPLYISPPGGGGGAGPRALPLPLLGPWLFGR